MIEINIQQILYNEFKKLEGKIIKLKDLEFFWLVEKVYFDKNNKAKIKSVEWNKNTKEWKYAGCNKIKLLKDEWEVYDKKELQKLLILDNLI